MIMVDSSTTGEPSDHMDVVFFHVWVIDFFQCVLITPDNNGWCINVKKQNIAIDIQVTNQVFFDRQIDARIILLLVINKNHSEPPLKMIKNYIM